MDEKNQLILFLLIGVFLIVLGCRLIFSDSLEKYNSYRLDSINTSSSGNGTSYITSVQFPYFNVVGGQLRFNTSSISGGTSKSGKNPYLYNDSNYYYFNETKLNKTIDSRLNGTTYYATSIKTYGGTSTTTNITLIKYYDDQTWNVTEQVTTPQIYLWINFTSVLDFNSIIMRERYLGGLGHQLGFQIWDYSTSTWENYLTINDQSGQTIISVPMLDINKHLSGGIVQTRFYHLTTPGNINHRLYLDFIYLVDGYSSVSSNIDISNFVTKSYLNSSYWNKTQDYANDTATFYTKIQDDLLDVRKTPLIYDEFTYPNTARVNLLGAVLSVGTSVIVTPKDRRVGRVSMLDSTTINGGYIYRSDIDIMYFTGNERFTASFDIPNLANTLNTTLQLGFTDTTTVSESVDGCYFISVNRNIGARCRNNSIGKSATANITLKQNQNYLAEIYANSSSLVSFRLYNYSSCTNYNSVQNGIFSSCTVLYSTSINSKVPQVIGRTFGIGIETHQSTIDAAKVLVNLDYLKLEKQ